MPLIAEKKKKAFLLHQSGKKRERGALARKE